MAGKMTRPPSPPVGAGAGAGARAPHRASKATDRADDRRTTFAHGVLEACWRLASLLLLVMVLGWELCCWRGRGVAGAVSLALALHCLRGKP